MECISKSSINYLADVSAASGAAVRIGLAASTWLHLHVLILTLTYQIKYAEGLCKVKSNTMQVSCQIVASMIWS